MSCFKLKVGDNIYTLKDSELSSSESDIVTKNDYAIIENFLVNGTIKSDYIVEDSLGNQIPVAEFFDVLNTVVDNSTEYSTAIPSSLTAEFFINHLIGQSSTDETKYANNIWTNRSWGISTWYGFTQNRGIVVTGGKDGIQQKLIFKCYEAIKAEGVDGTNFFTQIIDKLADIKDEDIFKKLTWVANNKRAKLFSLLLEIESKSGHVLRGRELRQSLRKNPLDYIGYNVSIGNDFYLVTDKSRADLQGDTINLLNIATGQVETKEISSISKMNDTKLVRIKNDEFYYIGGKWYLHKKNKFAEIDVKHSNSLSENFLSLTDKVVYDLRGQDTKARKLLDKIKGSQATIYADGRYWTMGENGFQDSLGNTLNGYETVYSVIADGEIEGINEFLPNCGKTLLSSSDIKIIGVEKGISDFENIRFSDIKSPVQISKNADGVYKMQISYNDKVRNTSDFESTLFNAFTFYNWLTSNRNVELVASLFNFETIVDMIQRQNLEHAEELIEAATKHFERGININKLFQFWNNGNIQLPIALFTGNAVEEAQNILKDNKNKIPSKTADKLFREFVDKGFFIYSCEI